MSGAILVKFEKKFKIPISDYLVFTSPMNAQAYYKRYKPRKKQTVFAIGATTAVALLELGIKYTYMRVSLLMRSWFLKDYE